MIGIPTCRLILERKKKIKQPRAVYNTIVHRSHHISPPQMSIMLVKMKELIIRKINYL